MSSFNENFMRSLIVVVLACMAVPAYGQTEDAEWPTSLIVCGNPNDRLALPRKRSVTITSVQGIEGVATFSTNTSTNEVCDAVQSAASAAGIRSNRLSENTVRLVDPVLNATSDAFRNMDFYIAPTVCVTAHDLGLQSMPPRGLDDFTSSEIGRMFNLDWIHPLNEVPLEIRLMQRGNNVRAFAVLNGKCILETRELNFNALLSLIEFVRRQRREGESLNQ